ncbi:MAG: lipid-A-disaccharide synthase [Aquificae bacterium]|nr:lipid-A-disaccharide synthase [Aquificota bacterium]
MSKKVFISLGDLSATNYIYEIFREGFQDLQIYGITDERLRSIGFKSIGDVSQLSVVGLLEVVPKLMEIRRLFHKAVEELKSSDVLVACDAPGFNLRLIKKARELGVRKVIYFISPQVWAWKPGRAKVIAEFVDDLIVILPFEVDIYKKFTRKGFRVHYTGHPLVDMVKPTVSEGEFRKLARIERDFVGLMPGSRWGEVKRHTPFLRAVVETLLKRFGDLKFVVPTFETFEGFLKGEFSNLPVRVLTNSSYDVMHYSRVSIIASGTASLEASLALNPHVVFYKVNPITLFLAKRLVKVSHISLTNLILKREVVPEFVNGEPAEVANSTAELLEEAHTQRSDFALLREILGPPGVIRRLRKLFGELIYDA